jgi:hypothetical protein
MFEVDTAALRTNVHVARSVSRLAVWLIAPPVPLLYRSGTGTGSLFDYAFVLLASCTAVGLIHSVPRYNKLRAFAF